jgi:hypothetical protein
MTRVRTTSVGKKEQDLYLARHNTDVPVACNFIGQKWTQKSLPFLDMIQDYACSPFIKSTPSSIIKMDGNLSSKDGVTLDANAATNSTSSHWTSSFNLGLHFFGEDVPKDQPMESFQLFLFLSQLLKSSQFLQA